jgi:SAM-dependent methyltransferase
MSNNDSKSDFLTRDQIHELITLRQVGRRPVAWEEDISRNTLDTEPFENLPPVTEYPDTEFDNPNRRKVILPLIEGETIEEYIARDPYPIPCAEDREGYSKGFDGVYWMSGLEDYLKIMDKAKKYGVTPNSVFDFGSASGRVVRHFAAQSNVPEIWGSDINARHVRWLAEFMPQSVKPIFNHCIPSLPMRDNSVDIISAFSVFTHIDTFETCWLAELCRILKDDGLAYITVHNEDTWEVIRDEVDNERNRLVQSLLRIDPSLREKLQEPMPDQRMVFRFAESGPYRAQVFHSNNFLERVWGRFFKIEEIIPRHHVRQTVLVMRKK